LSIQSRLQLLEGGLDFRWRPAIALIDEQSDYAIDFVRNGACCPGLRAKCNFMAMQQGDVPVTFADTSLLRALTGFAPKTLVEEGVNRFVAWYRDYFGV